MDVYDIWFDKRAGIPDLELVERVNGYLGALREAGLIEGFRVLRRKLGLGVPGLGEWNVRIEVRDLAQLDQAFHEVARRGGAVEGLHAAVNQHVTGFQAGLYRDFPDPHRVRGEELF